MSFTFILAGRLLQFALALAGVRIATTLLPPTEMGRVSLVLALTAFFALTLVNPVGMFVNRRLHAWASEARIRGYFRWYWVYLLGVCLVSAAFLAVLAAIGALDFGVGAGWLILLVAGSLFFNTLNQTSVPSLNMLGHPRPFMALTLATLASGLLASTLLLLEWRRSAELWLLGLIAGQAVFGWIGCRILYSRVPGSGAASLDRERIHRLFRFSWPIAVAVGFNWLHLQGYRFLLAESVGLAELGLFVAGYGLAASLLSAMETVLSTYFQPLFYRDAHQLGATPDAAWSRYAAAVLPITIMAAATVIAAAPHLAAVLLGPAYRESSRFVSLGAVAEAARVWFGLFGLMAHLKMNTSTLIVPGAVGAGLSTAAIWLLLPSRGVDIAPVAVAAGGAAVVVTLVVILRTSARFVLDVRALSAALLFGVVLVALARALQSWAKPSSPAAHVLALAAVAAIAAPAAWWMLKPRLAAGP